MIRAVQTGQIAHAMMIAGVEGGGNLPLALALAGYVFCRDRSQEDRCGNCNSCKQMDGLGHPDLHFTFPIIKSEVSKAKGGDSSRHNALRRTFVQTVVKRPYLTLQDWETEMGGENKKSIIPVEESREIVSKLSLNAFMGGHKILVIWMPEKMNAQAANALLKTLEEPPGRTLILAVTSQPDAILPTILSRMQLMRCARIDEDALAQALVSREGVSATVAKRAAQLAEGSYHTARTIAMEGSSELSVYFPLMRDWMRACVSKSPGKALEVAGEIAKLKRDDQNRFLEYTLAFLHHSLLYTTLGADKAGFDPEAAEFAEKFAPYIVSKDLGGFHDVLNNAHYLVTRNANPGLLFMKTSYELMRLFSEPQSSANHSGRAA